MKKFLIAVTLASVSLSGCTTVGTLAKPAPLAQTTVDEKTLVISLETFETVLTAVDRLVAAGVIKPGSPRALQLADAIQTGKKAYQAAAVAHRLGNASTYFTALLQAQSALAQINLLIKGS
jgi:hypothetical protein